MKELSYRNQQAERLEKYLAETIILNLSEIVYNPNLLMPSSSPFELTTPMADLTQNLILNYEYTTNQANDWMVAVTVDHILRSFGYPSFFVEKNDQLPSSVVNLTVAQSTGQTVIIDMPEHYRKDPYLKTLQSNPTFDQLCCSKHQFEKEYPQAVFYNMVKDTEANSVKRRNQDDLRNNPQTKLTYFPDNLVYFVEDNHESKPLMSSLIYHLLKNTNYDPFLEETSNFHESAYESAGLARIKIGNGEPANDKMITLALLYLASNNDIPSLLTTYHENEQTYWGIIYYESELNTWLYTNPSDQIKIKTSINSTMSLRHRIQEMNKALLIRDQDCQVDDYARRHPNALVYPPFTPEDLTPLHFLKPMTIYNYQHIQILSEAMEQKIEYPSSYLKRKDH